MGTGSDGTTVPIGRSVSHAMTREKWGNSRWTAGELFEDIMLRWLPLATNVVELGSGWTTVLLDQAIDTRQPGDELSVTSLEHLPMWYDKVKEWAPNVDIRLTPLIDYGEFAWYSLDFTLQPFSPTGVDLLLVDGPPRHTPGHDMPKGYSRRYGALPLLQHYLAPGCKIIIDDCTPEHELALAWMIEYGCTVVFSHTLGREDVLVLEYPGPNQVDIETGEKGNT